MFLVFSLKGFAISQAAGIACLGFYGQVNLDKSFQNVSLKIPLEPEIQEALSEINVTRPGIFSEAEALRFNFGNNIDLIIGQAKTTKNLKPGVLFEEQVRGAVVTPAATSINFERSSNLFDELSSNSPFRELLLYAREPLDRGMISQLESEGHRLSRGSEKYVQVEDKVIVQKFLKYFENETNISRDNAKYVENALQQMIDSARLAFGTERRLSISGIRIRWKQEGVGKDYDIVHEDFSTTVATTLSLIGAGTEIFYQNGDTLEIRGVSANKISHILGERSGRPVKHRASTLSGKRITLLIFWN